MSSPCCGAQGGATRGDRNPAIRPQCPQAEAQEIPHHITLEELPEEARLRPPSTESKHLLDAVKVITYRTETAMANSLRDHLERPDEARCLLRALYTTEADLLPNLEAGTRVRR